MPRSRTASSWPPGEGLARIGPSGEAEWRNGHLALDGVTTEAIEAGVVSAIAEWHPPGGRQTFQVHLDTGRVLQG